MVCICSAGMAQLEALSDLDPDDADEAEVEISDDITALSKYPLSAPVFSPEPSWLDLQLPTCSMSLSAWATISAMAQLRANVLAQLGIDLAIPGVNITAFARLIATLDARLEAVAELDFDAPALVTLATQMQSVAQVENALSTLPDLAASTPVGNEWDPFVLQIQMLAPLISVSVQLGIDLTADFDAQLSATIGAMMQLRLPEVSFDASVAAELQATLSAVASLKATLGVDVTTVGMAQVSDMVNSRAAATAEALDALEDVDVDELLELLPQLKLTASLIAPSEVVNLAANIDAQALAQLDWSVPDLTDIPLIAVGMPAMSLVADMQAALGLSAALSPCRVCDAASVLSTRLNLR